jgi:hypothetical protein
MCSVLQRRGLRLRFKGRLGFGLVSLVRFCPFFRGITSGFDEAQPRLVVGDRPVRPNRRQSLWGGRFATVVFSIADAARLTMSCEHSPARGQLAVTMSMSRIEES